MGRMQDGHSGQNAGHIVAEHRHSRPNASCKLGKIQGAQGEEKMHKWAEYRLHNEENIKCTVSGKLDA